MKIHIEIPDTTICMFINFVHREYGDMVMQGRSIASNQLHDGAVIIIDAKEPQEEVE